MLTINILQKIRQGGRDPEAANGFAVCKETSRKKGAQLEAKNQWLQRSSKAALIGP